MNRSIRKVAVLGSGIMGSRIACHFANIGVEVLLLDIVPKELNDAEKARGMTSEHPAFRNRIVNDALQQAIKSSPAPLYSPAFASRIKTGNFEDNLADIKNYDWVMEVVVERLDIKKSIFEKVDALRKPGTLVTSNTSGIPIHLMAEGRSEDFRKHFCGTHFFNPPRYLRLLEIIPTSETDQEIVDFLMHYGDLFLGKTTVLAKDTPGFIANRLGIYALIQTIRVAAEIGLSVDEVDKLTGPVVGRPKSGTYRLSDVVGLDTTVHVANNLYASGEGKDESRDAFVVPEVMQKLYDNKWLGDKTGQGFYKKIKDEKGKSVILALDFNTLEYKPSEKVKFETLEGTKAISDVSKRFGVLVGGRDKAGEFYRKTFADIFRYASLRIPEISDEIFRIDQAIAAGFGWQYGPFETWDAIGVKNMLSIMESLDMKPAEWVYEMIAAGNESFYKVENGKRSYYDIVSKTYKKIPGQESFILLSNLSNNIVWKNAGANLYDIGDGILNLEFKSKMNTMGSEVIEGINKGISLAEKDFRGLVIGNESSEAFSAGANLAMLFMFAIEQEFDEINMVIAQFQQTMMRARYSSIPVVTAPHSLALGGGCELNLHADKVVAHAETYIGLVEFGVGIIPAGGGTKEMALRCSDMYHAGDTELNILQTAFMNIAQAKVSTSAQEAREMNYLQDKDQIVLNRSRLIVEAKQAAMDLADNGYTQPKQRNDIKVQGKTGIALFMAGIAQMRLANYISDHDAKIANKLAYVINGGDLSYAQNVTEQYLLDLEREAFLSLCGEKKTLERMQGLLNGGKPPRN
ncbi:3-hydroxyacyl-CoA dehydrogenase/enoyl-CoA hydratase family protein [Dyadobacter chenhuakuii]|uniref:3-hydroxyacyl-CoA dehydrogenase/enoyl-CoA hydratase family protein n=1 Tax=Dyadobacter chenhuakuii TaxID=2909339 RepID=A0ABY4XI12_9BACT|nr:3-hydroxyacyl-CoA dehydrogenase/enoyl-CoA hydratase family protein [Dyadobacter chenhuakuii]MCF2495934.1 3-hydroxyacyl-CoA dehydrogenase/enoyl-CoA hydratase family protein [Dyadobacter chenhuakuii]USJ30005.1 3-hydroxyacyl-CoA dehydrogenase/enoyl-CoA hydratase family protein [Dyadobacter chenhuakuii]